MSVTSIVLDEFVLPAVGRDDFSGGDRIIDSGFHCGRVGSLGLLPDRGLGGFGAVECRVIVGTRNKTLQRGLLAIERLCGVDCLFV